MALSRSRLELLCRVADKKQLDAQRELSEIQRRLGSQQDTERELRGYLDEYEARPMRGATPALLENRRQFLLRLQSAVDSQHQQVQSTSALVEQARRKWLGLRNELHVTEFLLEQGCQVERRSEERKSQHEMDEFAATRSTPTVYAH